MSDATLLLNAVEQGDPTAAEKLLTVVYEELRRLAASKMAREAPGQTLQPTALVHEAWLRLIGTNNPKFENRAHFFAAAAEAMRRILIDRARRKLTARHGGHFERVEVDEQDLVARQADEQLLAVHEVLDKLAMDYPAQAQVVKLRYFAGMTNEEIAQVLGVSVATVKELLDVLGSSKRSSIPEAYFSSFGVALALAVWPFDERYESTAINQQLLLVHAGVQPPRAAAAQKSSAAVSHLSLESRLVGWRTKLPVKQNA